MLIVLFYEDENIVDTGDTKHVNFTNYEYSLTLGTLQVQPHDFSEGEILFLKHFNGERNRLICSSVLVRHRSRTINL